MKSDKVIVGKVLKPQGIKGQVKVLPMTDDPGRFLEMDYAFIGEEAQRRAVLFARVNGGFAYLDLEGVSSRDDAEALRNRFIAVARDDAVIPEGGFLIEDLKGMAVVSEDGAALGVLADIQQFGAADVYVVTGERPFQFPALKRVIMRVDVEGGVMTLDTGALAEVAVYDE